MNRQSSRPAAVVITVTTALLAAACSSSGGSSSAPTGGASGSSPSAVAWIQCVRTHGIPAYPGVNSRGDIPKIVSGQQVGVTDSVLRAAQQSCQRLWPYQAATPAQQQAELADDLKFAQCMRAHGLPNFPDPTNTNGHVEFVLNASDGINPHSPQVLAAAHQCLRLLPPGTALPSATEAP